MDNNKIKAKWIEPEKEIDIEKRQPPKWVQKIFTLQYLTGNEVLYITSHGCYEAFINGKRVGEFVFAPGASDVNKELYIQEYRVSELLKEGENEIKVLLGDGWYRSAAGVTGKRNLFGDHLGVLAWIESNDNILLKTDDTWKAWEHETIRSSDMCQGEIIDAAHEKEKIITEVTEKDDSLENLKFEQYPPVTEHERIKGTIFKTPKGETVIDFGQNIAGYVEMHFSARAGEKIVLTHGETLDKEGNFTIQNFQPGDRHKEGGIFQKVDYTAKEGENVYKPHFAIFGFRYVMIETNIDLSNAVFYAIAVYSKMKTTATFESSNQLLNKLFENALWSMKGNFCDVPTDCPTRERAGWTGDAGIFVNTGLYLMDSYPIFRKWLSSCRVNQYESGAVRNIAPKNNEESIFGKMLSSSAGWGDAIIIVPYTMYLRTGDASIVEENYEAMSNWIHFLERRAKKGFIKKLFSKNPYAKYDVQNGMDYGEWCEPDIKATSGVDRGGTSGVATAYLSYSSRLMSEMAEVLHKTEDAKYYKELSQKAKKAYQYRFIPDGKIKSDRQKDYVRPLAFKLLENKDVADAAAALNKLVKKCDYHLNTGFLSTPFLCFVLAEHGYVDTAYKILLQDTEPSWLYEVKQGATTIWETWNGDASLNHYSYGAIVGWIIEGICGIRYTFNELILQPIPNRQLEYIKAEYDSPRGKIKVLWMYSEKEWRYEVSLPDGVEAKLITPDNKEKKIKGHYEVTLQI